MNDHLEALERLARMRGEGTLTEEEFQTQKAALLAAPRATDRTAPVPPDAPQERPSPRILPWALGGISAAAFAIAAFAILTDRPSNLDKAKAVPTAAESGNITEVKERSETAVEPTGRASPVQAVSRNSADRFAYRFQTTPLEGPSDPIIQAHYTADFERCQNRAVTTPENAACFEQEFVRQDKELNRVWRNTLRRLPENLLPQLIAAERQWASKRDPFCHAEADEIRGTLSPVVFSSCRAEQTIRRTMWLAALR
jgi:uncharacterized protein YecT (DUF1311 family)